MRPGVAIVVTKDTIHGYVHIMAVIGGNYKPAEISRSEIEWPWNEIDLAAGVNVRNKIYDGAYNPLHVPHPAIEKNPLIDLYQPLVPLSNNNNPPLRTTDNELFQELSVFAVYMHGTKEGILGADEEIKTAGSELIEYLKKEYHLENE